jgi:hypothetical protein
MRIQGPVATNRFEFGNDITLLPKRAFLIQYDVTTSRWRPFGAGFVDAANIDATISRIIRTEVYQNKTLATGRQVETTPLNSVRC